MRVFRLTLLLICLLPLVGVLPAAGVGEDFGPTRWPHPRERGSYQSKLASSGEVLWNVRWETTVSREGNGRRVEILEQGSGQPWSYKEPITWEKRMVFQADTARPFPNLLVRMVKGSRWKRNGDLLSQLNIQADPGAGKILYEDSSKKPASAVLTWTPEALPDELLFYWARALPFERFSEKNRPVAECLLLLSPKRQFRIQARIRGTETVKTPAGTFSCYRIDLFPKLIGPLKFLAPKMALWCTVEPPHFWVRYEGPMGGPGSPRAIIELVKFEQYEQ